jgi:DNA-binding IscR family transcriptional regulator
MELSRREYYALEILSFLSSFPNHSWSHRDIAAVVVLDKQAKDILKNVSPNSHIDEVKKQIEKVKTCVRNTEDVRLIAETVRRLREAGLVRLAGGFRITDAGKQANVSQVMEVVGRPLKIAECIIIRDGEPTFDCPKRGTGACYSYSLYCQLNRELEHLLSKITISSMIEPPSKA